jgi:hypothetical protein
MAALGLLLTWPWFWPYWLQPRFAILRLLFLGHAGVLCFGCV